MFLAVYPGLGVYDKCLGLGFKGGELKGLGFTVGLGWSGWVICLEFRVCSSGSVRGSRSVLRQKHLP